MEIMSGYDYDTAALNRMLSGGSEFTPGLGKAARGWVRQRRITGVFQHGKNAKMWFNAQGVMEAWKLWANHKGLDFETDMPPDVRRIRESLESSRGAGPAAAPVVTVTVPVGTEVRVVYEPPRSGSD
jgi:hypothetical protein